jgi:hypothetical protein
MQKRKIVTFLNSFPKYWEAESRVEYGCPRMGNAAP